MRYDTENPLTAAKIVNHWSRKEIEQVLQEYGEERFARDIASAIVAERSANPISTTTQLVQIVVAATPRNYQRRRLHPATKTFLALRVAVNDELENLEKGLSQAVEILEQGGRLVVLSFQSLEDRIVKNFLRQEASISAVTKRPVTPSQEEVRVNPRARSAKLRAGLKGPS